MRPSNTFRLSGLRRLALGVLLLGYPLHGADSGAPPALRGQCGTPPGAHRPAGPHRRDSLKGVTRLAFTEADLRGREYVTRLMREAGLQVRVDDAGNLSGRRPGRSRGRPSIVLGSHIDTVPLAGAYDGVLGVMAAIECVQVLGEHGIRTQHPLEVIVFANEEGGMTGSRALAGRLNAQALEESSRSGMSYSARDCSPGRRCRPDLPGHPAPRRGEGLSGAAHRAGRQSGVGEDRHRHCGGIRGHPVVGRDREGLLPTTRGPHP